MNARTCDNWLHIIEQALNANQLVQAQQEAMTALTVFPEESALWVALGSIYSQQGAFTEAIQAFEHAIAINPHPTAFFALGSLYQQQNKLEHAEQAYLSALQRDPQNEAAYYNLALLYQDTQQYTLAFNCYEQSLCLNPSHLAACWNYASLLFARGHYKKAAHYYQHAFMLAPHEPDLARNYSSVLYLLGQFETIIEILTPFLTSHPEESEIYYALGLAYYHLDQLEPARLFLQQTLVRNPHRLEAYSNLNDIYARLQEFAQAQAYGQQALIRKDQRVCARITPASLPQDILHTVAQKKKIISFSLWGEAPTYTRGAIENAQCASQFYPGWTCRFYCDQSVPENIRETLITAGAEVILMPPAQHYEGLFWRFHVACDPTVGYFLCRDCDSRLNLREQAAVAAWLASGQAFHIMRDALIHSELILAGMWGGIANCLPTFSHDMTTFLAQHPPHRWMDQVFLREYLWPRIKTNCFIHDAYFAPLFGAHPFPESVRHLPPVGEGFKCS